MITLPNYLTKVANAEAAAAITDRPNVSLLDDNTLVYQPE